jgi:hypothetical protein
MNSKTNGESTWAAEAPYVEHLQTALANGPWRPCSETIDVGLDMPNLLLLPAVHGLLLGQLLGSQRFELAVVAAVNANAMVLDMGDARAQRVEKVAVVRDQQQDSRVTQQQAFQPQDGRQVQVIGGLVEQQHVGTAHQGLRQVEAHAPPPAFDRLVIAFPKPQPVQQAGARASAARQPPSLTVHTARGAGASACLPLRRSRVDVSSSCRRP